jgi:hypothetical protein
MSTLNNKDIFIINKFGLLIIFYYIYIMVKTITTRKPVNIELILNQQEELEILKKSVEFNTFVFKEVLAAITDAIKTKLPEAKIFNIINFNYILTISKTDFKQVLENMIQFHIKHEDYLVCKEIDKLIKKL